jgi:hypothetical protein
MTDHPDPPARNGRPAAPAGTDRIGSLPVVGAAGGVFCVALIFLALQMRAGDDPAIGAGAEAKAPPRPVIVRRVIVRRIVEEPVGAPAGAPAAPRVSQAPAQAAPAAPAAPPAPPAPVTTQAS